MPKPEHRYEVEVHLSDGQTVYEHVTEGTARELLGSAAFIWRSEMSDEDKMYGAILTQLAYRMEKGTGFLTVVDPEGKQWLIPADRIVTANVRDLKAGSKRKIRVGFDPILGEGEG